MRVYLVCLSTYTFWRFLIQIPLADSEMEIHYSINDGLEMSFFIPGRGQTMRMAAHSVSSLNLSSLPLLGFLTPSIRVSAMGSAPVLIQMNFADQGSRVDTTLCGLTC